jgi:hypothetical protein
MVVGIFHYQAFEITRAFENILHKQRPSWQKLQGFGIFLWQGELFALGPLVRGNICEKHGFLMPCHKNILLTHVTEISHAMVYGHG